MMKETIKKVFPVLLILLIFSCFYYFFQFENNQGKISILSYLSREAAPKTRAICLVLISLSLSALAAAGYLFSKILAQPPGEKDRSITGHHILILIMLGLFLFLLIVNSFFIGNTTYSKLLGAQDDAFITYKYAKNISEGNGFRFNKDEKVLGTTTPFYTLLLSFFGIFTGKVHIVGMIIILTSILLSGIFIYLLFAKYISSWMALNAGILFIFFPIFYREIGMETNFLIFLIILSLYFFSLEKTGFSFFILGLATLTRLEAVLLLPLLSLSLISRREYIKLLKAVGIYLLTIFPWFVYSYCYFGCLVPNTFHIKTTVGYVGLGETTLSKIRMVLANIISLKFVKSMFFHGFTSTLPTHIQYYYTWMLLFLVSFLVSLKYLYQIKFFRIFFSWVLLYIFAFGVLNVAPFIWYYVLALSFIPLSLATGVNSIFVFLNNHVKKSKSIYITVLLASLLTLVLFEGKNIFNIYYGRWYFAHIPHLERYETFLEISQYIKRNIQPKKTIAAEEIGIIGYYTRNKIWDFYSLIHKAGTLPYQFPSESPMRIPYLLTLMDPDYLLLNSGRLISHTVFQNYQEVKRFPVKEFQPQYVLYFSLLMKRKDRLTVLGEVLSNKKLSGRAEISGWVFGSIPVKSVELIENNMVISSTDTFYESPNELKRLFHYNRFSKEAVFHIYLDTTKMENAIHKMSARAVAGSKTGIFWEGTVEIKN